MGVKISTLTTKSPLDGTERLEIQDGGNTKATTAQDIANLGGGGGGTVESVTGDGVNNTDPANPILTFPIATEVVNTPAGTIAATTVQAAINELDTEKENVSNKATDFTTLNNTLYPSVQAVENRVLAALAGIKWKAPVRVATTVAGTLASSFENGDTVDGIVLATGNRILLKNQASASENGIYTVNASGAPTRATDADSASELEGASVTVQEGTSNENTTWLQTTDNITIGSSNIVFAQFGSSVPDASETVKGIIEIATQAETNTGTDDVRAITPLKAATRYAPLSSPALTGTPTAPTAAGGTNNTQIATTAFVTAAVSSISPTGSLLYLYNNYI